MVKFKVFIKTMMFVVIVTAMSFAWYGYTLAGKQRAEAAVPSLPDFEHNNNQMFIDNVKMCVEYVHFHNDINRVNLELLVAQAALESGWGTSRFAREGKNLFGIRTYDLREPHMLPWKDKPKKWGVKVFEHECDSVLHYTKTLNNHHAYQGYRQMREEGIDNPYMLIETLDAYASDKNYFAKIKSILTKIREEYK